MSEQSVHSSVAAALSRNAAPASISHGKGSESGSAKAVATASPSGISGRTGDFAVNRDPHSGSTNERNIAPRTTIRLKRWKVSRLNSNLKKEVEDSQADADFQAVNHQVVHGATGFDFRCGRSGCAVRRARSSPPRPAPRPPRGRNSRNSG